MSSNSSFIFFLFFNLLFRSYHQSNMYCIACKTANATMSQVWRHRSHRRRSRAGTNGSGHSWYRCWFLHR